MRGGGLTVWSLRKSGKPNFELRQVLVWRQMIIRKREHGCFIKRVEAARGSVGAAQKV